jgi:putative endopeptidase
MKNQFSIALSFLALAAIIACQPKKEVEPYDELASHVDSSVRPGDDFFQFANGKWFSQNPIPASESYNGLWKTIQDTINESIRQICENSASANASPGSIKQKIGDFYFTGMDSLTINSEKLNAISNELQLINNIRSTSDLAAAMALLHSSGCSPAMNVYVGQDDMLSDKHAVFFWQGGLGLPDRDYYFDTDSRTQNIRSEYLRYLNSVFKSLGHDESSAQSKSKAVFQLETSLAKSSRKLEDLRDPFANYHKMETARFKALLPLFDAGNYFKGINLPDPDTLIIGQPEFFTNLNNELKKTPLETWKDYLAFHLVKTMAPYLDDSTFMHHFRFYSTALRGIEVPRERWKRVVMTTDNMLGELIGQVYVNEYLPKGTKEKLLEIGTAIKEEFAGRIKTLDWMSDATKEKALAKLNTMIFKVGYPDKWKDMSALTISRDVYAKNVIRANRWEWNYMINKFGKPVDRTEWHMYPQTYNAYYNPSNNEIVVPGCNIIVPGYERRLADDAILYAIIGGSTFGHEITHGFDDQGSKYDEKGNLANWWTTDDSIRFFQKTKLIVEQYNNYKVLDSLHINGEATQGENIADLGGIMMGFEAFKKTKQYQQGKPIAGYTPVQRFFLAYALAWMINIRPEALATQVKTDVHSPARFRVIGPLTNMPEFYQAFNITQGDALWRNPESRIRIW